MSPEVAKPKLLFVSPVFPDVKGNGLAMRAGMFLRALSAVTDVYLLVVPLYPSGGESAFALIDDCTKALWVIQPMPPRSSLRSRLIERFDKRPGVIKLVAANSKPVIDAFPDVGFDVVHVFRLSMWPMAEEFLRQTKTRPAVHLDIDDIESDTITNIAALRRSNSEVEAAALEEREAARYKAVERSALSSADRVYVCSEADRRLLTSLYETRQVEVVPNAIVLPDGEVAAGQPSVPFRFLFVGTLGYYPNSDAVVFFHEQVVPLLRAQTEQPFQLDIVGVGSSDAVEALGGQPGINLIGEVDDVAESYAAADAVVIPLRAGGGTRIKALEAFAYKRAVVTTTVGIHGIDVVSEQHVLIGDTPAAFATQCLRLMQQPELGASLADAAHDLVARAYTQTVIAEKIRTLFPTPR